MAFSGTQLSQQYSVGIHRIIDLTGELHSVHIKSDVKGDVSVHLYKITGSICNSLCLDTIKFYVKGSHLSY